ncbi:MAG: ABC transporter permease [Alphaproteobacteria bacterium]
MGRLLGTRSADLVMVLFGVSVITFLMIRLIPGDAVEIMLGANSEVTDEAVAALRHRLGLDQPLITQYLSWLGGVFHGDLGQSVWTGAPVGGEILARIGVTIELTILSLGMAIVIGFPAGCLMAYIRGTFGDYVIRLVTIIGITIPSFWLGIVLIFVFFKLAPGFPSIGYVPFREDPLANLTRMILPTVALGLPIIASVSRIVRSTMLDALNQDYIRTARAKGLSEVGVVFGHALRNAAIPAVTNIGIMAGYLFGGAIVVEQVFALPGLGRLILGAIAERNYPLIQAAILVVTGGFVIINFAIDVLYMIIDPRISQR